MFDMSVDELKFSKFWSINNFKIYLSSFIQTSYFLVENILENYSMSDKFWQKSDIISILIQQFTAKIQEDALKWAERG